ncbi:hypothetical protein CO151_10810 [bacterium CG_4_9_14_3_um_filter_65_15]|nr:MAG: hypothetical protein CO151_10810 [bacterium CG_4_9_14_3_um_filter_65_15]
MPLTVSQAILDRAASGEIAPQDASRFQAFVERCNTELMTHSVITDNRFCRWFGKGEVDHGVVTHFIVQFSVFSNLFLVAQLLKTINAGTLEGMRASKEILANEIGVMFNKPGPAEVADQERDGDPAVVSTEGSVDGGTFRFRAAHFEWLLNMGKVMGLGFNDMGKRRHGSPATLFFCDQLAAIYGNEDPNIAEGASFAVENWAAAGFWKQLVQGLDTFRKRENLELPLAFFTWHDKIEDQHAGHVMDELEELYFDPGFDEDKFMIGGRKMLDGVEAFWVGLDEHRIAAAQYQKADLDKRNP